MKHAFPRRARKTLCTVALAAGLALTSTVVVYGAPRSSIHPYLEIQEGFSADFNRGGDVLTYTGVGGGVDANIQTRRVVATISYNYQRRLGWGHNLRDDDVHSGLAAVHAEVVPGTLSLDAGAMAARSHADPRFPVAGLRTVDDPNVAEIYSAYAGPTLNTHAGPVAVGASYRLGYVHVDDHSLSGGAIPAGAPRVERYTSSTVHNLTASLGMEPGELPVGWTLGGGYVREDMNRFKSRYEARYVRGDVVAPLSPTFAVTAGVGFEDIEGSQQDILRDSAGVPVIGPGGNLVADPSKPRLLTYDQSGFIYDAGVIWRPSPRTELQARIGRRYGGTTFTGSLEHRINQSYAITASVYDSVESFGRLLVTDLAGVPRSFNIRRSGMNSGLNGIGGCVFGTDPGSGACFDDALQSLNNFNFRSRGASVMLSGGRGPWTFGIGAGYANRRYLAPPASIFAVDGVTDQSFTLQGNASRRLTRNSGYSLDAYAAWFDSGIAGSDGSFGSGITGSYYHNLFGERLQANVSAGLYTTQSGPADSTIGSVLLGLRYTF